MIEHDGRYAVLHPTIAEAARRAGADRVGLIDVGRPAGLNLGVDRVAIAYGNTLAGEAASPVQVECSVVGDEPIPRTRFPAVEHRTVVHRAPLDPADPDDRAQILRSAGGGSARFARPRRLRFVDALVAASTTRTVAWVSVEGVGVAPTVPMLGDRPASGHSIMAVALGGPARRDLTGEAVGRCWSRGRFVSWFPNPRR